MKPRKHSPVRKKLERAPARERAVGGIRLNARMRDMGLASRREADELIKEGKVLVNGKRAALGIFVTQEDEVTLRGSAKELHYVAYHKPRGLPTQGEAGEDSVVTRAITQGLFPVGRLDKDSSGLLILTNDGRATTRILGEDSGIEKEYVVGTKEPIRSGIPAILLKGMHSKSLGMLLPAKAELVNERKIRIILVEGKKHQVRVMLAELGLTVSELVRTRVGGVLLGKMRPGQSRPLTESERISLLEARSR